MTVAELVFTVVVVLLLATFLAVAAVSGGARAARRDVTALYDDGQFDTWLTRLDGDDT